MDSPYKGLVPYAEEDADYFFGRASERRIISANLRASRLTLLYGESGVGKSSLLNAGVIHDLRKESDYAVVLFNTWQVDPVVGLDRALSMELPGLGGILEPMSYPDLAGGIRMWVDGLKRDDRRTLLIVLDQFEEYFQYHPTDSLSPRDHGPQSFAQQLPQLIAAQDLPVNFLVSIREDSLAGLDRFKGSIPNLFNNYLRVEHLSIAGAKDAILKPLALFNRLHPDKAITMSDTELADKVVQQLLYAQDDRDQSVQVTATSHLAQTRASRENDDRRKQVQAASLQVVMTRWWEAEVKGKSKEMLEETLVKLGQIENIVADYLDDTLKKLSTQDDRNNEVWFHLFGKLVTSTGRKSIQTFKELADDTSYGDDKIRVLLESLIDNRILTPVPAPKGARPDEPSFEFTHDLVAKAAAEWVKEYRRRRAEREATEARKHAEEMERLRQEIKEAQRAIFEGSKPRRTILGPPEKRSVWPDVLVLVPFTAIMEPVYQDHIKKAVSQLGLTIGRTDDLFGVHPIMSMSGQQSTPRASSSLIVPDVIRRSSMRWAWRTQLGVIPYSYRNRSMTSRLTFDTCALFFINIPHLE